MGWRIALPCRCCLWAKNWLVENHCKPTPAHQKWRAYLFIFFRVTHYVLPKAMTTYVSHNWKDCVWWLDRYELSSLIWGISRLTNSLLHSCIETAMILTQPQVGLLQSEQKTPPSGACMLVNLGWVWKCAEVPWACAGILILPSFTTPSGGASPMTRISNEYLSI